MNRAAAKTTMAAAARAADFRTVLFAARRMIVTLPESTACRLGAEQPCGKVATKSGRRKLSARTFIKQPKSRETPKGFWISSHDDGKILESNSLANTMRQLIRPSFDVLEGRLTPTNILFIGNSYTNGGDPTTAIAPFVRDIAVAAGQATPGVAERAIGGYTLAQHAAELSPASVAGLIGSADYAVFQGQSQEAWSRYFGAGIVANLAQGARDLGDDVRGAFPNARIVLYETWARPTANPTPSVYPTPYATPNELQADILAGYQTALAGLRNRFGTASSDIAPAGEAFENAGFTGDLYNDGGGHPSARGALLAALSIYGRIYEDNVSDVPASAAADLLAARGLTAEDWTLATRAADLAIGQIDAAKNQRFLEKLYPDVLGRSIDSAGLNHYLTSLTTGALSRDQVVDGLLRSDEYYLNTINAQFQQHLGRAPDAEGAATFLEMLRRGTNVDAVRSLILTSDEYYQRSGNTATGFVDRLYAEVLGRAPDPGENAAWEGFLNAGGSRSAVVQGFVGSREHRLNQANALYTKYLGRSGDAGGLNYFATLLQSGTYLQSVEGLFAKSDEYFATA